MLVVVSIVARVPVLPVEVIHVGLVGNCRVPAARVVDVHVADVDVRRGDGGLAIGLVGPLVGRRSIRRVGTHDKYRTPSGTRDRHAAGDPVGARRGWLGPGASQVARDLTPTSCASRRRVKPCEPLQSPTRCVDVP